MPKKAKPQEGETFGQDVAPLIEFYRALGPGLVSWAKSSVINSAVTDERERQATAKARLRAMTKGAREHARTRRRLTDLTGDVSWLQFVGGEVQRYEREHPRAASQRAIAIGLLREWHTKLEQLATEHGRALQPMLDELPTLDALRKQIQRLTRRRGAAAPNPEK
jgi:hypothetical protein